jgi:DNA helicase HerA-like ATPase
VRRAGVPVFLADVKGDLSGLAAPGEASERTRQRASDTGHAWSGRAVPVEFLSLTGTNGAQLRATVSSFGPLLLAKVLELNATQTSVLSLVFKYCDDQGLLLLDFADLRAVLQHLATDEGAAELKPTAPRRRPPSACCCARWSNSRRRGRATSSASPSSISTICSSWSPTGAAG